LIQAADLVLVYPAQRKGPLLVQFEPAALLEETFVKAATVDRRLRVLAERQSGQSGVLSCVSEKRTSFSKLWPQSEHWYS
jgi:hypothetical protein